MNIDKLIISSSKKRTGAFVIDDIIIGVFIFIIFYEQLINLTTPEAIAKFSSDSFLSIVLLKVIYQTFLIWQNSGKTIGKHIMKIKVVELENGNTPSLQVSLIRAIFRVVSEFIFYVGFLVAFLNPLFQTFHGKVSKTVVVDE